MISISHWPFFRYPGAYSHGYLPKAEKVDAHPFCKGGAFFEVFRRVRPNPRQQFSVRCSEKPSGDRPKVKDEDLAHLDEFTLEAKLQAAVESENYIEAARLRDRLRAVLEDSKAGVLVANTKFYKAFETGNLKELRSVWARGKNVHCIHPGAGRISGHDMVMASWELMLGPDTDLPLRIELHNVEVEVKGNLGYVTCMEVVRTGGSSWGKQLATNIFEKQNGCWYICMHHASHITP